MKSFILSSLIFATTLTSTAMAEFRQVSNTEDYVKAVVAAVEKSSISQCGISQENIQKYLLLFNLSKVESVFIETTEKETKLYLIGGFSGSTRLTYSVVATPDGKNIKNLRFNYEELKTVNYGTLAKPVLKEHYVAYHSFKCE